MPPNALGNAIAISSRNMAPVAGLKGHSPGDFVIVAGAAEFTLLDRIHGDLVRTRFHLKE
jgi:hypothetical protein